jgi:predicted MFS family arabinose efflux permease
VTRAAGAGGPDANGRRRAPPVRRDRTTWMLYGQLALYGYFLYGFGPTVPLLRDELGVSRAVGALHATAMAAGAVLGGLLSERVVASQGRRRTLWTGVWLLCAGIVGYCSGRVLGVTLLSAALCSLAGTLIINSVNATVMDLHGSSGPAALSQANAGAGAAGIVAPLAVGGAVALGLGWRVGLLAALPLALAARVAFRGVDVPEPRQVDPGDHPGGPRRLPRQFWLTWLVLVCTVGVEFCLSLWASDLLHSRTGLARGAATAGFSAVLLGLTASRLAGGRLAVHHDVDWLLTRALLVLLAGFGLFWVATVPWLALVGLTVAGVGLGVQYPLTIGRAISAAGGRTDLAASRASLAAGLASGGAPFLLGAVADRVGTHTAFLLVPVLVVLALAGLAVSGQRGPFRGVALPLPTLP